jgi:hypothetical protein
VVVWTGCTMNRAWHAVGAHPRAAGTALWRRAAAGGGGINAGRFNIERKGG